MLCFRLVQELSGHLAAEITRLCSLAKQDALQLNQGMDVYEMEVSLGFIHSSWDVKTQETVQMKMRGNCYLTSTFHPYKGNHHYSLIS